MYIERGLTHALSCKRNAEEIIRRIGGNAREIHLAGLAAFSHELGYSKLDADNTFNKRSVTYIGRHMKSKYYPKEDIMNVCDAVLYCHSGNEMHNKIDLAVFLADKMDLTGNRIIINNDANEEATLKLMTPELLNLYTVEKLNFGVTKGKIFISITAGKDFDYKLFK